MCLRVDDKRTKNFWSTGRRKNKNFIWAYKVYKYNLLTRKLYSFYYNKDFPLSWGEIKSNRTSKNIRKGENDFLYSSIYSSTWLVYRGIHVCLSSQAVGDEIAFLRIEKEYDEHVVVVVVRVKCFKEDFVACGSSRESDAVFMKVHIPRSEYRRIRKKFATKTKKAKERILFDTSNC